MITQQIRVLADLDQQENNRRGLNMTQYTQEHADLLVFQELIANAVAEESDALKGLKESLSETISTSTTTGELITKLIGLLGTQSSTIINVDNSQTQMTNKLDELVNQLTTLREAVTTNDEFITIITDALNETTKTQHENSESLITAINNLKIESDKKTENAISQFDMIREDLKFLDRTNDFTSLAQKIETLIELVQKVESIIKEKESEYETRMVSLTTIFTNTSQSLEGVMERLERIDLSVKELSARVQATSVKVNAYTDADSAVQAIKDTLK